MNAPETMTVQTPVCFHCHRAGFVTVLKTDYERYKAGALAQVAFPEMLPGEREMLISGTHPKCWDEMFADEED